MAVEGMAIPRAQVKRGLPRRTRGAGGFDRSVSRQPVAAGKRARTTTSLFVLLFIAGLVVPWVIFVGPLRLSPYRIVLVVTLLPCLGMWITGRAGRVRLADFAVLLYALWCSVSLIALHGFDTAIQPSGILFIETVGSYFLARCYIRSAEDFYNMVRILFFVVLLLLPFALFETITGNNISMKLFSSVLPAYPISDAEPRWGLRRAQTVFEHPILFGVCAGSILAMTYLVLGYGQSFVKRSVKTGLIGLTSFLSLSAGPISAVAAQFMLLGWNGILEKNPNRWKLLWLGIFAAYLFISVASNQSVPAFYITHFSFDQASAYYRILIWEYGTGSVAQNPLFGTGLGEWLRPDWMPPSIDMFWLTHAVYYGLPAAFFMGLLFLSINIPVAFRKNLPDKENAYRTAYLIAMTGYFLVGWTVHFWNASYVLFVFLLASGVWLLDCDPKDCEPKDYDQKEATASKREVGRHASIYLGSPNSNWLRRLADRHSDN